MTLGAKIRRGGFGVHDEDGREFATYRAKVTSKGQVTVPLAVRESLGLQPGDQLVFREGPDGYVVTRDAGTSPFARYAGLLAKNETENRGGESHMPGTSKRGGVG